MRIVYGTTLAMYLEIDRRLRDASPAVQVLAMGDSLSMTQFQPDIFAADHALPANAVFNASGVRVRELPITPDKILMGLTSAGTMSRKQA